MTLSLLIEKLPEILVEFPEVSLVYLFGSQVNGQVGRLSDYDLAIQADIAVENSGLQFGFQHAMVKLLNTERVDVILLQQAPIELAYHVIAEGKLLYQKDLYTRVEVEAGILSRYGDYLPTLRLFRAQILKGDTHAKRVQRYRAALRRTQRTLGPPGATSQ